MIAAIETPSFINTASRAGVSEDERNAMVGAISAEPDSGDLIQGPADAASGGLPGAARANRVAIAPSITTARMMCRCCCWW
jgi:hypothetical protein